MVTAIAFFAVMLSLLLYFQEDGIMSARELTFIFTLFVMLQFWNLFNAKTLGQTHSAFSGILANRAFLVISLLILGGQIVIVEFGGVIFRTVPLDLKDWVLIGLGTSSVLLAGEAWRFIQRLKTRSS